MKQTQENNIRQISWERCAGCCLCANVCPVAAIEMRENAQGFLHPVIDDDKCVNCGKCLERCPVHAPSYRNSGEPECRAVIANDEIRLTAASGGVFSAFAEALLQRGGMICGAAYDDNFAVRHILSDTREGLEKIRSSKYVQSDAGDIYRQAADALDAGREVLFSGCPCQVAAMYAYLGNQSPDNLYTMDVVCHGVPSPKAFRKYLREAFPGQAIRRIDFRDKSFYGWSTSVNVYFDSGEPFRRNAKEDWYLKAFLNSLSVRKACSNCPFSNIPRQGDLTIGDFWGVSKADSSLNDKKGTSIVLVNNEQGRKMLEARNGLWKRIETVPLQAGLAANRAVNGTFRSHAARKRFFENLDRQPLEKLVNDCLTFHYDVGIVGLWYGLNYGSILTYYALYQTVRSMGLDALMINKPAELWTPRYADRKSVANRFIYKHCNVSNIRPTKSDWRDLNQHCDAFIVGSDVVWNYQICGQQSGQFFFLDFVRNDRKKIAMASSFGAGYDAPESERSLSAYYLKQFDYVAVRESDAVEICMDKFGVKADKTLDPVFLCDRAEFERLAETSEKSESAPFMVSYFLGPDLPKKEILLKTRELLGLPLRSFANPNVPGRFTERTGLSSMPDPSVEDWLYYIKNADFFIGDSFHGLCFSLIFNTPFLIAVNSNVSGLTRFTTLLKTVGLEDRMVFADRMKLDKVEKIIRRPMDFSASNKILEEKARESFQWLQRAVKGPKRYEPTPQEIINDRLYDEISRLEAMIQRMSEKK